MTEAKQRTPTFVTESAESATALQTLLKKAAFAGASISHGKAAQCSNSKQNAQHANLIGELLTAGIDAILFMSAAGVRSFIEHIAATTDRERLLHALQDCQLISGSTATTAALLEYDLQPSLSQDALPDWRTSLKWLESQANLSHAQLAMESTLQDSALVAGLERRGVLVDFLFESGTPAAELDIDEQSIASAILVATSIPAARAICASPIATRLTNRQPEGHIVVALGSETADFLSQNGIELAWFSNAETSVETLKELFTQTNSISAEKQKLIMNMSGPMAPANDRNAPWYNSSFMKACRGEPTDVTPIWMMRQAGRYMSEYREVRSKISFLDLCANPKLCSEVMCTAVDRLGVDAAIIFSDLLPMLVPMGCDLEFVKGDGPVIHNPIRTASDVDRIKALESNDALHFVMETVTQTRTDLPADMPLIGFSGAPFTLASYMIEGGSSRNYAHAKSFMFGDRGAWDALMEKLTESIVIYLQGQIDAGAQCVQLFDSWAGCLNTQHYREYSLPWIQQIIERLPSEVPVINFGTGNTELLPLYADTKASVVGVDWRVPLDEAWQRIGHDRSVQGNLDPTILLTDPDTIRQHAKQVLDQAQGRAGHIFNLGHGILPMTPIDNAIALVDAVHELSRK